MVCSNLKLYKWFENPPVGRILRKLSWERSNLFRNRLREYLRRRKRSLYTYISNQCSLNRIIQRILYYYVLYTFFFYCEIVFWSVPRLPSRFSSSNQITGSPKKVRKSSAFTYYKLINEPAPTVSKLCYEMWHSRPGYNLMLGYFLIDWLYLFLLVGINFWIFISIIIYDKTIMSYLSRTCVDR